MLHPLAIVLLLVVQAPAPGPYKAKVVGISDGDTITVLRDKTPVKVRLHGVDAPESGQPFGAKAKARASDLAFGLAITVDPRDTDRYGRSVASVELPDGRDLGRELVRDGMAWHYRQYAPDNATLRDLQAEARGAKRGLWAEADPVAPWDWRAGKGRGPELPTGSVVANRSSRLYHAPTCRGGAKIAEKNRATYPSEAAAEAAGYKRAGDCK